MRGIKAGLCAAFTACCLAGAASAGCDAVHQRVVYCDGDGADSWAPSLHDPGVDGIAVYGNEAGDAGKVIVQITTGVKITQALLENAILRSLLTSGPEQKTEMLIDELSSGKVDGLPAGKLQYKVPLGGKQLRTVHSYLVSQGLVLQFITMTPLATDAEAAQMLHREFLGHFRIQRAEQLL